jgi:hypothetical protein
VYFRANISVESNSIQCLLPEPTKCRFEMDKVEQLTKGECQVICFKSPIQTDLSFIDPNEKLLLTQEIYLKRMLLNSIVDEEAQIFLLQPEIEKLQKLKILGWLYRTVALDFPLFKSEAIRKEIDLLLLQLPKWSILARRATKSVDHKRYSLIVSLIDLAIRTPNEPSLVNDVMDEVSKEADPSTGWRREVMENIFRILSEVNHTRKFNNIFYILYSIFYILYSIFYILYLTFLTFNRNC